MVVGDRFDPENVMIRCAQNEKTQNGEVVNNLIFLLFANSSEMVVGDRLDPENVNITRLLRTMTRLKLKALALQVSRS